MKVINFKAKVTTSNKLLYSFVEVLRSNHRIEEIQSLWLYLVVQISDNYITTTKFAIAADILEEPEYFTYFGDALKRYKEISEIISFSEVEHKVI